MEAIIRVISGAQTGADRGGLDAAIELGVEHGGYCPKGRLSEDGVIPEKYNLKETSSSGYTKRTEYNILMSDGTVVFTKGKVGPGSWKTIKFAEANEKPCLHIDVDGKAPESVSDLVIDWLNSMRPISVLNVAGSRESSSLGIQEAVKAIMLLVLSKNKELA